MRSFLISAVIIMYSNVSAQHTTATGIVKDSLTKELLPWTYISLNGKQETLTNNYGFFAIKLKSDTINAICFSRVGYTPFCINIYTQKDSVINIALTESAQQLKEVVIGSNSIINNLSLLSLSTGIIKNIPTLGGEPDILKSLQTFPGVSNSVEGTSGIYVRGGDNGQNLIILDEAPVYNATHLFGLFSVFNADAIKNATLYKDNFPSRYGGRVSSIIDIQTNEGGRDTLRVNASMGLISSRVTIQAPLFNKKASFLVAARRTYLDLLTQPFQSKNSFWKYRFYDTNLKFNYRLDGKTHFFINGFLSGDKLIFDENAERSQSLIQSNSELKWKNTTVTLRFNRVLNSKLFFNTSVIYSKYQFELNDTYNESGIRDIQDYSNNFSSITNRSVKFDIEYFAKNHAIESGLTLTMHDFSQRSDILNSVNNMRRVENNIAYEYNGYLEDNWKITPFTVRYGIRFSAFHNHSTYENIEPRIGINFLLHNKYAIDLSYTKTYQYLHLLSNTGAGLPTDTWIPASSDNPPQEMNQIALGISRRVNKNLNLSLSTYRRYYDHIISYKDDAVFLSANDENPEALDFKDNITSGVGVSYGTEMHASITKEPVSLSIGYTLSWVIHQFEEINNGRKFFPTQDNRHNLNMLLSYKISKNTIVSAFWEFKTGSPLTVPQGYYYANYSITPKNIGIREGVITEQISGTPYYGTRGSLRGDNYHRLDLSIKFYKQKKKIERYWEVSIFNAYNRKNPFYYYVESTNDFVNMGQALSLKKRSLLPIIPSISYNIKF